MIFLGFVCKYFRGFSYIIYQSEILDRIHMLCTLHSMLLFTKVLLPQGKIEKPNNLKVFGSNKTKGPKQDSQSRLSSYMTEGGQP
jgi:hypothetical protein